MKKIILLLSVCTLMLTSCNKDDDNSSSQDLLIGTWKFYKYFENNIEIPLEACENEQTLGINANGTYTFTDYIEVGNTCEIDEALTGTWRNAGNGVYVLDEETDAFTLSITFEGNTFFYTITYNNGTENVTDKYVYKRP
ncbi:MAG: lipocalin family protein [Gelidibacter sp.]